MRTFAKSLIALSLATFFVACGGSSSSNDKKDPEPPKVVKKCEYKIIEGMQSVSLELNQEVPAFKVVATLLENNTSLENNVTITPMSIDTSVAGTYTQMYNFAQCGKESLTRTIIVKSPHGGSSVLTPANILFEGL